MFVMVTGVPPPEWIYSHVTLLLAHCHQLGSTEAGMLVCAQLCSEVLSHTLNNLEGLPVVADMSRQIFIVGFSNKRHTCHKH